MMSIINYFKMKNIKKYSTYDPYKDGKLLYSD